MKKEKKDEKKPSVTTVSDASDFNIRLQEIKNNCEKATKLSKQADLLSTIALVISIARLVFLIIEATIL